MGGLHASLEPCRPARSLDCVRERQRDLREPGRSKVGDRRTAAPMKMRCAVGALRAECGQDQSLGQVQRTGRLAERAHAGASAVGGLIAARAHFICCVGGHAASFGACAHIGTGAQGHRRAGIREFSRHAARRREIRSRSQADREKNDEPAMARPSDHSAIVEGLADERS